MITVVSGKTGYGKSLDCVRLMRDHLAAGGCVATNIRLDVESMSRATGRRISPRQILQVDADTDPATIPTGDLRGRGTRKTIVCLDECLNWFASSVGARDPRKEAWSRWLRQSDKLGQSVWFVAQNFERAAKWIRELAATSVEIFPLREIRIGMVVPIWLFFPPAKNMYCRKVRDVRSGMVNGLSLHFYSPAVYKLYDTSETFGFVGAASAYDAFRLWPRYRPPVWAFGFAVALFVVVAGMCGICCFL